ncbi:DUF1566 domain-containing protein [Desulfobotulus mexicanus]|uniref:DUF1566 domain-containing protein n=1 Tax=Desulfobotulus mexicanus TaxID=2586642 RepID=A0A5Q4VEZ0_9BACT|nr:DUF1566 domain-containing protein [Desulfobotulus mexicanus]
MPPEGPEPHWGCREKRYGRDFGCQARFFPQILHQIYPHPSCGVSGDFFQPSTGRWGFKNNYLCGSWYDASPLTAPGGFRLPTIEELRSLAPYDLKVFPSEGWFWSASSISSDSGFAWNFFFINGLAGQGSKKRIGHARLVRVGQ